MSDETTTTRQTKRMLGDVRATTADSSCKHQLTRALVNQFRERVWTSPGSHDHCRFADRAIACTATGRYRLGRASIVPPSSRLTLAYARRSSRDQVVGAGASRSSQQQ